MTTKEMITKALMVESWDIAKQALINVLTTAILNLLMMLAVWGFFAYQMHQVKQDFQAKIDSITLNYDAGKDYIQDQYEDSKDFVSEKYEINKDKLNEKLKNLIKKRED